MSNPNPKIVSRKGDPRSLLSHPYLWSDLEKHISLNICDEYLVCLNECASSGTDENILVKHRLRSLFQ